MWENFKKLNSSCYKNLTISCLGFILKSANGILGDSSGMRFVFTALDRGMVNDFKTNAYPWYYVVSMNMKDI